MPLPVTTKTVTLAHPLSADHAQNVGATEIRPYEPGEQVTLPTGQVMRLVSAGLVAGVDPSDSTAVAALFVEPVRASAAKAKPTE